MRRFWTGLLIVIVLIGIGFLIWWFLTGGDNTTSTPATTNNPSSNTAAQQAATKEKIRTNWEKFFDGSTPADQKTALLQNGQQFSQTIDAQAQSPTAKQTSANVSNVDLNGSDKAIVTYSINENGQPELKNQTGQAVLENGTWKVSDASFCSLLQLSGSVPPNCPGANSSQTQSQPQGATGQQAPSGQTQSNTAPATQ